MTRFSWQSYLVSRRSYARWIDEGLPPTTHAEFAYYLKWIFSRARDGVELRSSRVTRLDYGHDGWTVHGARFADPVRARLGVVMTGPGTPRGLPVAADAVNRVIGADVNRDALRAIPLPAGGRVCVVGSGESAASMALFLLSEYGELISLTFLSSSLPYSRLETYLENAVYSDAPAVHWARLPEEVRREFIRRTDRGVMSPTAVRRLVGHPNVSFAVGRVEAIRRGAGERLQVVVRPREALAHDEFDLVLNCTGFDPLHQVRSLLSAPARTEVETRMGVSLHDRLAVSRLIDDRLALPGVTPHLHVPALAGLAMGPGFANLSSLGALSDRVLAAYRAPGAPLRLPTAAARKDAS